jgi:hypothetical protein
MDTGQSGTRTFGDRQPFLYDLSQRHNHRLRALVFWLGEWEVLMYRPCSDVHRLLVVNGMFHLQLWHPESQTSILTPTSLTGGMFETTPLFGSAFQCEDYKEMAAIIEAARNIRAPTPDMLSDVFFAMFSEFAWRVPDAAGPPSLSFEAGAAAK